MNHLNPRDPFNNRDPFANFDRHFEEHRQRVMKTAKVITGMAVVGWVISIALLGAIVYVAAHFIAKVW